MAKDRVQNYGNHARVVPLFHFVTGPILLLNVLWRLYDLYRAGITFDTVMGTAVAVALLFLYFFTRHFAITVQDRVIRLEMRLRMAQVLPPDLKGRINDFTLDQLVALRFASEAELPDLARKVLAENLNDRKAIKQMIKNWQADFLCV